MSVWIILLPMFTMGLISSAHCIGMCGGIMGALTMAIPESAKAKRWLILVAYNSGRIASYACMGLFVGFFAGKVSIFGGGIFLRIVAGLLLITMGFYLADWWRGLTYLEKLGRYLWVYVQPLGKKIMPVDNIFKALLLGALWGWLPCGLVYSALALAMTQPSPILAASAMLAFGLGTLPAVFAAGIAAHQLTFFLQQRKVRIGLAFIIIAFGSWTIWGAFTFAHHHHHDAIQEKNIMPADDSASGHSKIHHHEL